LDHTAEAAEGHASDAAAVGLGGGVFVGGSGSGVGNIGGSVGKIGGGGGGGECTAIGAERHRPDGIGAGCEDCLRKVPEPDRAVKAAGGERTAIGAERHRPGFGADGTAGQSGAEG